MIVRTIIQLIPMFLFSLLAKEYIIAGALTFALLLTFHITRLQQRRIEKLQDEYRGQRSINRIAAETHRAAYTTLQQRFHSFSNERIPCTRAHYDHPSAETVRENRHLQDRLHQLRHGGKTLTYTRTHYERSTAEMTCANRVLIDNTRKLRNTIKSLRSDVDHREKSIKRLQRSWEALRIEALEEIGGRDASIEDLQNSLKAAAAHHDECYTEIHRLNAAGLEVESVAREFERELRMLRGVEVASRTPEDVGPQVENSDVLQEDVNQESERRPLSPKCAAVEDEDEEEEL